MPEPVTSWPTVRFTEATVPAIVEVSDASFRFVSAVETEDSAEVTEAWSESSVLWDALAAWSLARRSWADVSWACAALNCSESAVVSTVANTSPAVTVWPAFTFTAVTVPETAKFEIGLTGRLERARTGDRLLNGARRHGDGHRGDGQAGGGR